MRVLFFISSGSHGRGGHSHSLNHIASALGEKLDIGIFSIGANTRGIVSENPYFIDNIIFSGWNLLSVRKRITNEIKKFNPDIIHCFDAPVYNILSFLLSSKHNLVLNQCGGPNPIEYPYVQNIILFSKENKYWFEDQGRFKTSSIYLIPNRINSKELFIDNSYRPFIKKEAFCFVRIARICKDYAKSIEDSINLLERFNSEKRNVHLYIIGVVQVDAILTDLKRKCDNLPVTFITDDQYTKKASNLLYLADAVIATGRGAMEAMSLGIPVLTPAQNAILPILVTADSFENFFATNFSPRNVVSDKIKEGNLSRITKLINDPQFYRKTKSQSLFFFTKYFDVRGAVPKYIEVYKNVIIKQKSKRLFFENIKYQIQTILYYIYK